MRWSWILFILGVFASVKTEHGIRDTLDQLNTRHHETAFNMDILLRRQKRWDFSTYKIIENQKGRQKITTLRSSFDTGNGEITYSISGHGAGSLFEIDKKSGDLFSLYPLDREALSSYSLNVSAHDLQGIEVENASVITIEVEDRNDNAPEFNRKLYYATVKERSLIGTALITITATDKDDPDGPYGQIEYSLLPSKGSENFIILPRTGEIQTAVSLDREKVDTYELHIQAKDDPGSQLCFYVNTTLSIKVIDVNDNPPLFTERPYRITVPETREIAAEILKAEINDADLGANTITSFSILSGADSSKFSVVAANNKGVVKIEKRLDYETSVNHEYRFRLRASNVYQETDPGIEYLPLMQDIAEVIVTITDVNEPPEFNQAKYTFSVKENTPIGSSLFGVAAFDPEGDIFSYWLEDDGGKFLIDRRSGMVTLNNALDREATDHHEFIVAAGHADLYNTAIVLVRVADVNDNPPTPMDDSSLQLILCEDSEKKTQVLYPNITMIDVDSSWYGFPIHYFPIKHENNKHFKLIDNNDNTATMQTLHNNFYVSDQKEYRIPILVQDNGIPKINATYPVTVRVCYCGNDKPPVCDAVFHSGGFQPGILVALVIFLLLLIIVVMFLVLRRRRRSKAEALIKGSLSSSDIEIQEHFVSYNEEGGGEEDTAAFDLAALRKDCCSSASGLSILSHTAFVTGAHCTNALRSLPHSFSVVAAILSHRNDSSLPVVDIMQTLRSHPTSKMDYPTPPSTKLSYLPPNPRRRPFVPSQDIREFIAGRKMAEDNNERKLAFDSLQVYGFEGEGSEAGSLSSLCSSNADADHDYDYLKDWGPRFHRLADMYGANPKLV